MVCRLEMVNNYCAYRQRVFLNKYIKGLPASSSCGHHLRYLRHLEHLWFKFESKSRSPSPSTMYFTTIFLISKSPLLPMLPSIYPTNTNRNPVLSSLLSLNTAIPLHYPVLFLLKNNCPFPVYIREAVAEFPSPRPWEHCKNWGETPEAKMPAHSTAYGGMPVLKDSCGHSSKSYHSPSTHATEHVKKVCEERHTARHAKAMISQGRP